MAYFRIFADEKGVREEDITKNPSLLGRKNGVADIVIDSPSVSRSHAFISQVGEHYFIEDAGSRYGTFLDGARIYRKEILRHGCVIDLGGCLLEFRTDDATRIQESNEIRTLIAPLRRMRTDFKLMPAAVRIRYRVLSIKAANVFATGDTLLVGDGGLLLPDPNPPSDGSCLEVEITAPGRQPRTFPADIRAVLSDREPPELCIKLHKPEDTPAFYEQLASCRRGCWVLAQPGAPEQAK